MGLSDIYYITVSISAVAATAAFIISVIDQIRERRELAVQKWRRAVIQQMFQGSSRVLSFDEIAQRYRNEAVGYASYNLKADELSPQSLRLVLLEMIHQLILEQRKEDKYSLRSFDSGVESYKEAQAELMSSHSTAMAALQDSNAARMISEMGNQLQTHIAFVGRISNEVFNLIGDEPFRYTISDLSIKVSQKLNAPIEVVRGQIVQLVARKMLQADERGRVGLGANVDRSAISDFEPDD
ncbi:hypothetical protein [Bradyrhizobium zhanjiangense]|uniref:Uncharacterized protein n=1 Tax=Bradyrhizobium zhanjiangense TaxID=1325107 RepID=A0A4Q0Q7C5_9BRAD|nr:hypothetical protein [Bradyrhizobium zhanjiangense]RXG84697.1 hypothetical protein EAS61_38100 [Bradyrhizobium zhanjiangense]